VVRHVATAALAAALVTSTIFLVMLALVRQGRSAVGEPTSRTVIEYVRVRHDSEVETRSREPPKKLEVAEAPAVPELRPAKIAAPASGAVPVAVPAFHPSFSPAGVPAIGAGADTDVVPLVRVDPLYPARAQARGVEGSVHLRFTITPQGTTTDIEVLEADPPGYFERAATNAVRKYRYKPKIVNGVPVARPGVEIVISFELEG
jgi:protein TonB